MTICPPGGAIRGSYIVGTKILKASPKTTRSESQVRQ
jgi:hypothetical protein